MMPIEMSPRALASFTTTSLSSAPRSPRLRLTRGPVPPLVLPLYGDGGYAACIKKCRPRFPTPTESQP